MKIISLLLLLISLQAKSELSKLEALFELPAIDVAKQLSKNSQSAAKDLPLRIAITR